MDVVDVVDTIDVDVVDVDLVNVVDVVVVAITLSLLSPPPGDPLPLQQRRPSPLSRMKRNLIIKMSHRLDPSVRLKMFLLAMTKVAMCRHLCSPNG